FELLVDIVSGGEPVRRVRLTAPLGDNVAFIVRAADDHLRGLTADGEAEPSFQLPRELVTRPGHDLLGLEHAQATQFRHDKPPLPSPRRPGGSRARSPAGSRGRRARTTWCAHEGSRYRGGTSCAGACSSAPSRWASGWVRSWPTSRCRRASRGRGAT